MTNIVALFQAWLLEHKDAVIICANPYLGAPISREMMGNPMTDEEVLAHFNKVYGKVVEAGE